MPKDLDQSGLLWSIYGILETNRNTGLKKIVSSPPSQDLYSITQPTFGDQYPILLDFRGQLFRKPIQKYKPSFRGPI